MGRVSDAREKLITAAMQLIWQRSYNSVGVNELCRQAGVKPGSFYYFFPSKRDLLLAALEENWRRTQLNVLEPAFAADVPPRERIAKIFELAYQQQTQLQQEVGQVLGCPFGSMGSEMGPQDEMVQQKIEAVFAHFTDYFEQALQEGIDAGLFNVDDVPARAQALLAYLEGTLLLARTHNNAAIIQSLGPMALTIAGLKAPAGTKLTI